MKEAAVIAIYFGAHWAPPSRLFTERLIKFYEAIGLNQFQVVFVSDDGNFNAFMKNFALMPWFALPYQKEDIKLDLKKLCGINGIPHLMILSGIDGSILVEDASKEILGDPNELF